MKFIKITTLFVCIAIVAFVNSRAQSPKILQLKKQVTEAGLPTNKIKAIFRLCEEWRNLPADTVRIYASQAMHLATLTKDENALWFAKYYLAISLLKSADYDRVIEACNETNNWLQQHKDKPEALEIDNGMLLATAFIRTNQYKEASAQLYQILTVAEETEDTLSQIKTLSFLGWVQMEMDQQKQALDFFYKALSVSNNPFLYQQYGILFSNIASTYNNLGKYDSAFFFVKKAIAVGRQTQSLSNLCNALNIEADIYLNKGQIEKASDDLNEALAIRKQIGDPYYTVSDMAQLALFYAHNGMQAKGIQLSNEALALADSFHLYAKLSFIYSGLAENYKMLGNYKAYSQTLEKIASIKDSLYMYNKAEALAETQARYDLQKKETTIMRQKVALAQRHNLIVITIALMALGSLSVILFYLIYTYKHAKKIEQMRQYQAEATLKAVNEAEETQLRRIAAELHDNIGAQISYISSSIDWIVDPPIPLTAGQQTERLNSINETSHNLMRNMRETIWALTSSHIKLDEFADKLKLYIQAAIKFKPQLQFHSAESIEDSLVELQPMQALNLFRIFQEAVNNSIKYAQATNMRLRVVSNGNKFCIEIKDDGIGFEPTTVNGEHYGLINMRYRAAESDLQLDIHSKKGEGTCIEVKG